MSNRIGMLIRSLAVLVVSTTFAAGELVAAPTVRDYRPKLGDYLGGRSTSFSLLDPSRMTISHDVQMGFSSFGGGSVMQSLYATNIGYRLSDPLTLTFTLGLAGGRYNFGGVPATYNSFIGGARLDYSPSKDVHLRLQFDRVPGLLHSYRRDDYPGFSTGVGLESGESTGAR